MPKKCTLKEGDLLYHSVHGLCRVQRVLKRKEAGKDAEFYSLIPKCSNQMKVRFTIHSAELVSSGFHSPISCQEANKILDGMKKMKPLSCDTPEEQNKIFASFAQSREAWEFAEAVVFFSRNKAEVKEQRKRQMLDRAVKGLVGEISVVLEIPVKEAVARVRKSLEGGLKVNPSVLVALAQAVED